ncbi:Gfo/Idh/MocA family oxidoreductase, partial [bacterium]|nr:Gfo/Idh/MocA family oxidoreductase [bacterium]
MEKTNRIKIGLVGVGKLGAMHAASLAQNPQADLVGVFDSDVTRSRAIAEKHRCTAFASVDALLQEVEAVGVIVPTTLHAPVALQALSQRKPVFVEKPIAATVPEAEQLVAAAHKSKTPLQV